MTDTEHQGIEVRFLDIDKDALVGRLGELGAVDGVRNRKVVAIYSVALDITNLIWYK